MGRAPCCDKAKVKKGPWSPEEDATLKSYIEQNGTGGNWIALPQKIGLKRCGKSCRLRWLNYLRPNIKHGGFTEEEENIICNLYVNIGSRWSIIAAQLPGRTDNDIKNYWNTRLKKKLMAKQRKEQQAISRAGLLEHELKREFNDNFLVHQTPNQQVTSYWAESPIVTGLHTMHQAHQDGLHLGTEDHMTRLLMKLGGQLYEDPQIQNLSNNNLVSYQYNPIQEQLYQESIIPNYAQLSNLGYESQGTGFVAVNSSADIEAYLNNLMQFEGSTSYSGGNSNSTPSSASVGATTWGEMTSLVNTPVSDFDTYYQQGMLQKVGDHQ